MGNFSKFNKEVVAHNPQFKKEGNLISSLFAKITFMYRVRAKMTQKELADQAGVSPSTIHRIEGGGGGITDTTYFKVFDVLGVKDEQIVNFLVERETGRERELAFNR